MIQNQKINIITSLAIDEFHMLLWNPGEKAQVNGTIPEIVEDSIPLKEYVSTERLFEKNTNPRHLHPKII
jgi:hypothetical protein